MENEDPVTPDLNALRRKIDLLDDQMLDLLVARAAVVKDIGAAKQRLGESVGVFLRPGREMEILRRLMRRARGSFPRSVIVRIWREMFSALVALQGPMTIGVHMPYRGAGFLELARDAYGSYSTTSLFSAAGAVVRAVTDGEAVIGILPLPGQEEGSDPWWTTLATQNEETPKIVARLPFISPETGGGVEGFVIARLPQEDTGHDHSLLTIETTSHVSRAFIRSLAENAGLAPVEILAGHAVSPEVRLYLLEVRGCLDPADPRIQTLADDPQTSHVVHVGGYAVPFSAQDLAYDS